MTSAEHRTGQKVNIPNLYEPTMARDPKLAIKSSFPEIRAGLAWLITLSLSCDGEIRTSPHQPKIDDSNHIEFTPAVIDGIRTYFSQAGLPSDKIESILDKAEKSPLVTAQLEPMITAFEIFMPLSRVEFKDATKTTAAERSGGSRFEKVFYFTANLIDLSEMIARSGLLGAQMLYSWIADVPIDDPASTILYGQVQKVILRLSADTIYRIESDGGDESHFNTIGLYRMILSSADGTASIHSAKERKGPLRLLPPAIKSGLLPWLSIEGDIVSLAPDSSREEANNYVELLTESIDLSNVKRPSKAKQSDHFVPQTSDEIRGDNLIVYGVPGCGKSHYISYDILKHSPNVTRVVFHPDYLYSNFVGQILPRVNSGDVSYEFTAGPFTVALANAFDNPSEHHYLVIEEINRGNAPAIFGDVFHLLDRSPDGSSEYSVSNSSVSDFLGNRLSDRNGEVYIPSNLSLLATMNTSDQNVFTLDTAFQRRWRMHMVKNDISEVSYADDLILDTSVTWRAFMEVLNGEILTGDTTVTSSEDKRLGRFFLSEQDLHDTPESFAEKAIKYLWDDAFKFDRDRVFVKPSSSLEDIISDFSNADSDERWHKVFTPSLSRRMQANSAFPAEDADLSSGSTFEENRDEG